MSTPQRRLVRLGLLAVFAVSHLATAAIKDGLIAHWAFDESGGTVAADTTTNANHGTLHSFPADNSQWAAGQIGRALQFRGPASGDHVRVVTYPKPATNLTVAAWVWADARPLWASIAKNWGSGAAGQFHFGLTASDGDLSCYLSTAAGATPNQREGVPLPLGSWQHLAFTADGTTLKLYRNGAQVGSTTYSGGLVASPMSALGIGVKLNDAGTAPDSSAPGFWQGKLDDLGLWNRALNSAEISAIVAAGLQGRSLTNAESQPVITGGGVRISEFMASNKGSLTDDFGEASDWIEIHNDTPVTVNLDGWCLTDKSSNLSQWRFPATNLPPGDFLLVFASSRDRRVPGTPLHTNFKLDAAGEYLALVRPDGTVATQFAPGFPLQVADVSFGFGIAGGTATSLLSLGASGHALVPDSGALGTNWISATFNDSAWPAVTNGVGFETGVNEIGGGVANDLLADAPLGWWRLTENNGAWATNSGSLSPVGDGQWGGGVTPGVAGPQPPNFLGFETNNRAARFDGVTGKIEADYTPDLNPSGPFTVECWVRPTSGNSLLSPLSSVNYAGSSRAGYVFFQDAANRWSFYLGDANGYVASAVGGAVAVNAWQHLAGVYSGSNALLYVNGLPVASATLTRAFAPNRAQKFRLGAGGSGTGHRYFAGDVDEAAVFNRALGAAEISQRYQIAVSNLPAGATTNFNYAGLIKTDLQRLMYGSNATAYLRLPFVLTNAAAVSGLTLRLKYDDGFAAFLNGTPVATDNAPVPATWKSAALGRRATSEALQFAQFDVSGWANLLRDGTNVLALQGLNYGASNADFLVLAELAATTSGQYDPVPRYLFPPTPGGPNGVGSSGLGPLITSAGHTPTVPGTNDSLSITCRVTKTLSTVGNVTLHWRVMYGATSQSPMFDDGLHNDGAAGDGVYGAFIDRTNYRAGQMVRWIIHAADSLSRTSRWPLFPSPTDSAEYLGTVAQPDAVAASALPVLHWFVENSSSADTDAGTRCSLFYDGQFYDNVGVRIRGGTSRSYPKKSYKFELNAGDKFFVRAGLPRVSEFNLNAAYTDKSYVRSVLAAEHQRDACLPVMEEFHLHVRQNTEFFSVAIYVEQPDDDFLSRHGLDSEGALYKALGSPLGSYEKKTRLNEDNSDLGALLAGLNLTDTNQEAFLFDNVNLANAVNFMATVAVTQNIDASDKNHYLHRDTDGTREWRILPWDLDLTFGPDYLNTDTIVSSLCDTNAPHCPSHPFIGARPYLLHAGKYHPLLEAIVNTPRARQMLLRRVRTLTDQFFAANYFQNRIEELFPLLEPDVQLDHAVWGANAHFPGQSYTLRQALDRLKNEYLAPRATFLTGTTIIGIGLEMPASQPTNAVISIRELDYNPASGNQDEEFVCLTNANPFGVDLSGWTLTGGVRHTLEAGTVIPAHSALYASPNAAAFRARVPVPHGALGLFAQGNYQGRLNAWGESLALTDPLGRLVSSYTFIGDPSAAQRYLRITEIMYNPAPLAGNTNDPQQFEFIELKNISATATLNLAGVRFAEGITFGFAGSLITTLAPGQTVLVVRNLAAFTARYGLGFTIAGEYAGALNNGGENLRLEDAVGEKILEFAYNNTWYPITDGPGFSLVIVNEHAPWDTWFLKPSWRASSGLNGSPGGTDPLPPASPPEITGIHANGNLAAISTTTLAGYRYSLEYSADLGGAVWIPIWPQEAGTGGVVLLTDTNAPATSRFYRVRVE